MRNFVERDFCDLFWPPVTLTFDLQTPIADLVMSSACGPQPICASWRQKLFNSFLKYCVYKLGNRERTDG